ncbi:hypothetical protein CLU92_5356 [Janthinobacterium sp. 61]|uniref:hypothetical protein n=1 Tax=Janthinobacterium sp. 61 TaxID=2035209 RepID=UPI000C7126C2|nr:hypothetical protein [Janthinobacterium sp. 61]PKV47884.1 hypothetical protein CLU92_5356 [Janthinobacterium sp. 61]
MNDKQVAELRKFLSKITDPKISAFIDLKKLCQSGIYNLAVQMATEHAIEHKNYMYLNSIFGLIDDTPYAINFITALRPRLNFTLTDTKPRKLKHATLHQVTQAPNQPTAKPIAVKNPPPKQAKIYDNKREVSEDVMDSRLMLPGSYGAGRRR